MWFESSITVNGAAIVAGCSVIITMVVREGGKAVWEKVLHGGNGEARMLKAQNMVHSTVAEVFTSELQKSVLPVLTRQSEILSSLVDVNSEMKDGILKLVTLQEQGICPAGRRVPRRRK